MKSLEQFGARIGQQLVDARESESVPRVAATAVVDAIMARHPRVKLPELLGAEEVRQWMSESAVTESMLRTALTDARKRRAAIVQGDDIKRPRRRRRSGSPASNDQNNREQASSQLIETSATIPNGSITDL